MPVIVASQVTQSGSTISGDTSRVVIVKTSSGYAPDAGHAGSGVIVAETCGGGVLAFSSSQLTALLSGEIAPSGKGASIGAILQHGGFSLSFKAPAAGTATVEWLQPNAKVAKKGRSKARVIAAGRLGFSAAKTATLKVKLTTYGRRVLRHAKRLRLTAKGTFAPHGGKAVSSTRRFLIKR